MANPRGIFTLKSIVTQKILGESVPLDKVFINTIGDTPIGPNVGYFYGGYVPSPMPDPGSKSIVGKIDFSADTASRVPTADLTDIGYSFSGNLPNRTDLYIIGGRIGVPGALGDGCQKLTFASNTISPVPGGSLSAASYQSASVYNGGVAGYMVGGSNPSFTSEIQKFEYASETASTITDQIPVARNRMASIGSVDAGYIFGGNPGATSEFIKFEYSTESISPIPARTPGGSAGYPVAQDGGGVSNTTAGYYMPGYFLQSEMSKFTFSTENPSLLPGVGFTPGSGRPSTSGNTTQGYFALPSGPSASPETTIHKMNYSTDGLSPIPGTSTVAGRREGGGGGPRSFSLPGQLSSLPIVSQFITGITPQPNIGYTLGGAVPAYTNKINKFDMSTETASNPGSTLPQPQGYASNGSSRTDAYIFGGTHSAAPYVFANCYTVEYSSETAGAIPGANLTAARYGVAGTTSADAVYSAGGFTPSQVSRMDKMTFSNETTVLVPNGSLTRIEGYAASMGSQSTGYWGGTGSADSNFDKLSYSSDTTSNSPSMSVSYPYPNRKAVTGVGFAFINGGPGPGSTQIEKADFSTETVSPVPSANLIKTQNHNQGGFCNNDFGYFAGGNPGVTSEIDKLTYSSSTVSASPSQLVTAVYAAAGSSPRSYNTPQAPLATPTPQTFRIPSSTQIGYMSGGINPSLPSFGLSTIYKLNMSDESVALVPGQNTTDGATGPSGKYNHSSTGNSDAGYYSGNVVSQSRSFTDKNTYSTETVARVPALDLPVGGYGHAGVSITTNGFLMGGTPNLSSVQKITFASDSVAVSSPAQMPRSSRYFQALGTTTAGYGLMGEDTTIPAQYSNAIKLTYSSETSATIPLADVPTRSNTIDPSAVISGNSTAGYFQLPGNPVSTAGASQIVKFTYSNDTSALAPSAELLQEAYRSVGMGDGSTAGYILGGRIYSTSPVTAGTYVQKLTFSDDTTSNIPATISQPYQAGSAISAADFGLPGSKTPAPVIC